MLELNCISVQRTSLWETCCCRSLNLIFSINKNKTKTKQCYCKIRNMDGITSCWMFKEPIVWLSIWLGDLHIWRWKKSRQILERNSLFHFAFYWLSSQWEPCSKRKEKIQFNFALAKFHNLKVVAFLSVFPKQIFSFASNLDWKRQKMSQPWRSVGFVLSWLHEIQRANLNNMLVYLTCCAKITVDVISQRIGVLGRRFCGDSFYFFSIFLCLHWWDVAE